MEEEYPTYEEDLVEDLPEVSDEDALNTAEIAAEDDYAEAVIEDDVEDDADIAEEEMATEAVEEANAPEAAPAEHAGNDSETNDFNLATLNQLVDEIREESQRVAEMKQSVSEALQLIQEMSESLKS